MVEQTHRASLEEHLKQGEKIHCREIVSNIDRYTTDLQRTASLCLNLDVLDDILKRLIPGNRTEQDQIAAARESLHHARRMADYFLPHTRIWFWWTGSKLTPTDLKAAIKALLKQIEQLDLT